MDLWIKSPNLWTTCIVKTLKEIPKSAAIFWGKVRELYQSNGGRFQEPELEPEYERDEHGKREAENT